MYNASEKYKEQIKGDTRNFALRMTCRGVEITEGFVSAKLSMLSGSGTESLEIGSASAAQLDITMQKPDMNLTGAELYLEIGLLIDDVYEYIPLGYFQAQKPTTNDDRITFTAYDAMVYKLSGMYSSQLSYPCDIEDVCTEIESKTGVIIKNKPSGITVNQKASNTESEGQTNPFDGYTYRETIAYIAGVVGKFATINRSGELEFRWFTDIDYNVSRSMSYSDVSVSDYTYSVDYVSCIVDSSTTLTAGDTAGTGISVSNILMTQELLNSIYEAVKDYSYKPTSCTFVGDPCLDLGDVITVESSSESVKVPVMSLSLDYDGGLITGVASYGSTTVTEVSYKSPTATYVDKVYKELAADKLSVSEADVKYANIDFSNIGEAAMTYFYSTSGLIKDVKIGEATISGELVGVTISGDLIKGNTVMADKLVIKGEDGLYYKLNTDGITTEAQQTDYNSINGSVIKAKSITASKITVSDLVAFGATIGGFNITASALYSGVKTSVDNTTQGIYLDSSGQMSVGNASSYLKYYKNQNGKYVLDICVDSVSISKSDGSVSNVADEMESIQATANAAQASADKAQATANTANSTANTANSTATAAKTAAATAQSTADGIKSNIYTANTTTIDGGKITTGSITADKIKVTDLTALGATIGGFHITDSSIYSGAKSAPSNTSNGIYLGSDGQFVAGGSDNYLKFYDDNGSKKVDIRTDWMSFSDTNGIILSPNISSTTNSRFIVDNKGIRGYRGKTSDYNEFFHAGFYNDNDYNDGDDDPEASLADVNFPYYTLGIRDPNICGAYSVAEGYMTKAGGNYSHSEGFNTVAIELYSHAEGDKTEANGYASHAEGQETTAGFCAHAEGIQTKASGQYSHAEGEGTIASVYAAHAEGDETTASGTGSHAEGCKTVASGNYSHVEGNNTTASGTYSHAEGNETTASGTGSHAEGYKTVASGIHSHAGGNNTTASGDYSHAVNRYTIAASQDQTAIGKYNIKDASNLYAFIVGNGSSDRARKNALTVDWSGNVTASKFTGSLAGNATSATKATQDGNGKVIASTYLPLTGGTLTGNLTAPTFVGALSGNATSATKLATARKIGSASFNGTADITLAQMGAAAASHTHSYLPLTGGTLTGDLNVKETVNITEGLQHNSRNVGESFTTNGTENTTLPSGSWGGLGCYLTMPVGNYIVYGEVTFSAAAIGRRIARIASGSSATNVSGLVINQSSVHVAVATTQISHVQVVAIMQVTSDSNSYIVLQGWQDTGKTMTVLNSHLRAMRVW